MVSNIFGSLPIKGYDATVEYYVVTFTLTIYVTARKKWFICRGVVVDDLESESFKDQGATGGPSINLRGPSINLRGPSLSRIRASMSQHVDSNTERRSDDGEIAKVSENFTNI